MVKTRGQLAAEEEAAAEAEEVEEEEEEEIEQVEQADEVGDAPVTVQDFIDIGADIMSRSPPSLLPSKKETTTETFEGRWVSHFNAEAEVCLDVWNRLQEESFDGVEDGGEPQHLLWACLFLQVYAVEGVLSGMCGCDEDTYRLYVWRFVEKISYLEYEVVSSVVSRSCCCCPTHPFVSSLSLFARSGGRTD